MGVPMVSSHDRKPEGCVGWGVSPSHRAGRNRVDQMAPLGTGSSQDLRHPRGKQAEIVVCLNYVCLDKNKGEPNFPPVAPSDSICTARDCRP